MIHSASTSTTKTYPTGYSTPRQGYGTVSANKDPDIITLKTGSETLMIQAPGHPFKNGDEVFFEYVNGTFFLSKSASSEEKNTTAANADLYLTQKGFDTLPLSEILQTITRNIEQSPDDPVLTAKYLQQLTTAIKNMPATQQTETLLEIIDTINKSDLAISPEQLKKILTLINDLQKSIAQPGVSASCQSRLIAILDNKVSEGVYQFNSIDTALQFLNSEKNSDFQRYIANIFENEGCVSIRVFTTQDNNSCALLLNNSILPQELVSMLKSVSPEILDTFPLSLFQNFLKENKHLDISLIKLLSSMPVVQGNTSSMNAIDSEKISSAALLHWLNTVNEHRECATQLSDRIPANSTATVKNVLENIQQHSKEKSFTLDDVGIVIPGNFGKNAVSVFANVIRTLGFTLENDLLSGTPSVPSLKTELLHALSASRGNESISVSNTILDASENEKPFISNLMITKLQRHFSNFKDVLASMPPVTGSLKDSINQASQTLDQSIHILQNTIVKSDIESGTLSQSMSNQKPLTSLPSEISIEEYPTTGSNKSSATDTITRCINLLNSLFKVTEGITELDTLRKIIIELQTALKGISSPQQSVDKPLDSVSENHSTTIPSQADPSQKLRVLPESYEKLQSIMNDRTTGPEQSHKIETMLHRLESLQLLSRQVTTQDGTGQILAIPVKIGQEWTEVSIRMIKKENSDKSSPSSLKHYTVYLDVAPSLLGDIHATLNYEKGRNLSILMQFEHKEVTSWFRTNSEYIRKMLQNNDIHFVNIDFKTLVPSTEPAAQVKHNESSGNIDIKI